MQTGETPRRIAFNAIFELTETYFQISEALRGKADCFFITPDIYTFSRLLKYGIPETRILNLSITKAQLRALRESSPETENIALETEKYGPTFASLIMMSSRFYNQKDAPSLYRYFASIAARLEDFLRKNDISMVISEPTTAPELITYSVCAKLGITAANIAIIRHPAGRCAVFTGIEEAALLPLAANPDDMQEAELAEWLINYRKRGEKTITFDGQSVPRSPLSLLKSVLRRAGLTIKEIQASNELNYTNFKTQTEIFSRRYRSAKRRFDLSFDGIRFKNDQRPYFVYFLHVQPERTVDVMSPRNSNQLEVIRQLRMALPSTVKLAVKDHPSAYGVQPPEFYRGLENIPDVSLIESRHSSFKLLSSAACAVTITGTVGMEAALLDTPAVVLSNVFFGDMPNVFRLAHPGDIRNIVPKILGHVKGFQDKALLAYLRGLIRNSHPCDWLTLGGLQKKQTIDSITELLNRTLVNTDSQA